MSKTRLPFTLRLTSGKLPSLLVALLIITFFTAILTLIFIKEGIDIIWGNYAFTIEFNIAFGYLVFITHRIHKIHEKSFYELLEHSKLGTESREKWKSQFFTFKYPWRETLISIVLGVLHAGLQGFGSIFTEETNTPIYQIWAALMIIFIWIAVSQSSALLLRNMTVLNKLSREVKIDLLNMEKFMPLTKSGVWSILGFIGIYTILFMKGISQENLLNPAILVLGPLVFFMIHTPLKGLRKRVIAEKERELKIIDAAIEGDHRALERSRIGANLSNINVIDLISYKKTIQNTFEIPVNIPTASRFIFYLIIPLLTWIAASMVDKGIDYLIK